MRLALVMTCFADMTVSVYAAGTAADVFDFPNTQGCPKGDACPMYDFTDVNMDARYHDGVHF